MSTSAVTEKPVETTSRDKSENQHTSEQYSQQFSVNSYILNEEVTDAEIFWSIEVVLKKYSPSLCDGKNELFQAIFKDIVI